MQSSCFFRALPCSSRPRPFVICLLDFGPTKVTSRDSNVTVLPNSIVTRFRMFRTGTTLRRGLFFSCSRFFSILSVSFAFNCFVCGSILQSSSYAQSTLLAASKLDSSPHPSLLPANPMRITTSTLPAGTSGSSYVASLMVRGATPPYQWTLQSGQLPTGLHLDSSTGGISGVPSEAGRFPVSVSLHDAASHTASQDLALFVAAAAISAFDGPAELPRTYLYTTSGDTPASGRTIHVPAGGDFQAALNDANCGDTIALQAGATFSGVFHFPAKPCDGGHWIVVRTSASNENLPNPGTRITPC